MTAQPAIDHNKMIAAAAKEALSPLGFVRDGKTKVWHDDHGWWCIVIEFQPHNWLKGSFLNVGVSWLLFEKAHWTFDVGYREQCFSPAETELQFADALSRITAHAVERVRDHRERFATIEGAHRHYQSAELRPHWDQYHAAVIAGLAGDIASARRRFETLLALQRQYQWQQGLYCRALDLSRLLDRRREFLESVTGIVLRTRTQLLLEERAPDKLGLPDEAA